MTKETDATLIARLRDNLEHISGQLVERTAQLVDLRGEIEQAWINGHDVGKMLANDARLANLSANARLHRMADRKPWKLVALTAVAAFVVGAVVL